MQADVCGGHTALDTHFPQDAWHFHFRPATQIFRAVGNQYLIRFECKGGVGYFSQFLLCPVTCLSE